MKILPGLSRGCNPFEFHKILRHADRVNTWLKGGTPPPVTVGIDITNACNSKCPECTYLGANRKWSLGKDLVFSILETLVSVGVKAVVFSGGGEPLMHPEAVPIITRAHELGLPVGLITNGLLINQENAEAILQAVEWTRISLNAGTREDYALVHGISGESLDKVLKNLETLAALKSGKNLPVTIGASFIAGKSNMAGLENAVGLVRATGINYFQIKPMYIHTDQKDPWKFGIDRLDCEPYLKRASALQTENFNVIVANKAFFMGQRRTMRRGCPAANFVTQIAPSGPDQAGLYVCCEFKGHLDYKLGEVKEAQTFLSAWESKRAVVDGLDLSRCKPCCAPFEINEQLRNIQERGALVAQSPEPVLHERFL